MDNRNNHYMQPCEAWIFGTMLLPLYPSLMCVFMNFCNNFIAIFRLNAGFQALEIKFFTIQ